MIDCVEVLIFTWSIVLLFLGEDRRFPCPSVCNSFLSLHSQGSLCFTHTPLCSCWTRPPLNQRRFQLLSVSQYSTCLPKYHSYMYCTCLAGLTCWSVVVLVPVVLHRLVVSGPCCHSGVRYAALSWLNQPVPRVSGKMVSSTYRYMCVHELLHME